MGMYEYILELHEHEAIRQRVSDQKNILPVRIVSRTSSSQQMFPGFAWPLQFLRFLPDAHAEAADKFVEILGPLQISERSPALLPYT